MDGNEEGGVCTQKVTTLIAVIAIIAALGVCLTIADDASAEPSIRIDGDSYVIETESTATYDIIFYDNTTEVVGITYTASLKDSSGNTQTNAVSPSSGSVNNGVAKTLTITAPASAGTYELVVVFSETVGSASAVEYTESATIRVKEPFTLTVTLTNDGTVDYTNASVYFYVDGAKIEDSATKITVAAGETTTASYDWVTDSLSNGSHTVEVKLANGDDVVGSSTFYVGHSDYTLMSILMGVFFVVLLIIAIYIYRKPVKNYGKPKARR